MRVYEDYPCRLFLSCKGADFMSHMTKERFEREKKYRVSLAIAKNLLNKEIITKSDYRKMDTMLTKKYNPLLGNV